MLNKLRKALAYFTLFTLFSGVASPILSGVQAANNPSTGNGQLQVNVNLNEAEYTVYDATLFDANDLAKGVITTGKGTKGFSLSYGSYLVKFKDIFQYSTPTEQVANLDSADPSATINGTYNRANGQLQVNVNVNNAKYKIYDATLFDPTDLNKGIVASGEGSKIYSLGYGSFLVKFEDVAGYTTPAEQVAAMTSVDPNNSITAIYNRTNANLEINVNLAAATYTIYDATLFDANDLAKGAVTSGKGSKTFGLNFGSYLVKFDNVTDYITPGNQTATLTSTSNNQKISALYIRNGNGGTVNVTVRQEIGTNQYQDITDGNWEIFSCTDSTCNTTTPIKSGKAKDNFTTNAGWYYFEAKAATGYDTFVRNIDKLELKAGQNIDFIATYTKNEGKIVVNVKNNSGTAIKDADWEIFSCADQTCNQVTSFKKGTESSPAGGFNAPVGRYKFEARLNATNSQVYDKVVYTQTIEVLALHKTITFDATYDVKPVNPNDIGTLEITQGPNPLVGTVNVKLPTGKIQPVGNTPFQDKKAVAGTYQIDSVVAPAGYEVDTITDGTKVLPKPYQQTLAKNGAIKYVVTYKLKGGANQNKLVVNVTTNGGQKPPRADYDIYKEFNGVKSKVPPTQISANGVTIPGITEGTYTIVPRPFAENNLFYSPSIRQDTPSNTIGPKDTKKEIRYTIIYQVSQGGFNGTLKVNIKPEPGQSLPSNFKPKYSIKADNKDYYINLDAAFNKTAPGGDTLYEIKPEKVSLGGATYTPTVKPSTTGKILKSGDVLEFDIIYVSNVNTGTIKVTQKGANGDIALAGPSPATITGASYTAAAQPGDYSLAVTRTPAGFVVKSITDGTKALNAPYPQKLEKGKTIEYIVEYEPLKDFGEITVEQVGGTGVFQLNGPSALEVKSSPYTNPKAGVGSYSITNIRPPTGFTLDRVEVNGTAEVAPYKGALAKGGKLAYKIIYTTGGAKEGTIEVEQINAKGEVNLTGPNGKTLQSTDLKKTFAKQPAGDWSITIKAPTGYVVDKVENATTELKTKPYTQKLEAGKVITYKVTYKQSVTETLEVNQINGAGDIKVKGPTPATIPSSQTKYSQASAVGDYTLAITNLISSLVVKSVTTATQQVLTGPYPQKLTAGTKVVYNVEYAPIGKTGTVKLIQQGATGVVQLNGPTPREISTANYNNASGIGDYNLSDIRPPAGFKLKEVQVNGKVEAAPYSGKLEENKDLTYTVVYQPTNTTNTGTVIIKQIGANGTIKVNGPNNTSYNVATADDTKSGMTVGDYTIDVTTVPNGFVVAKVNGNGTDFTKKPYTLNLQKNGVVTFIVTYSASPNTETVEVTQNGAGTLELIGPTPATITQSGTYSKASGVGDYELKIAQVPTGSIIKSVKVQGNVVNQPPFKNKLVKGTPLKFNVEYGPIGKTGTLKVEQVGGTGTVEVFGPSAAIIKNSPYSSTAGIGDYIISNITPPAGYTVNKVEVNGTPKAAPYSGKLEENKDLTYKITYTKSSSGRDVDLAIDPTISVSGPATPGSTLTYTVKYKNLNTNNDARGVKMVITYDKANGTIIVPPNNCIDDAAAGTLTCNLADVPKSSGDVTFNFGYKVGNNVAHNTEITQQADISTTDNDIDGNNNSATVKTKVITDFEVTKTASVNSTNTGSISFTINVKNNRAPGGGNLKLEIKDAFGGQHHGANGRKNITGTNKAKLSLVDNTSKCINVLCTDQSGRSIDDISHSTVLTELKPGETLTITYDARGDNSEMAVNTSGIVDNFIKVIDTQSQASITKSLPITILAPVRTTGGGGGGGGGYGGGHILHTGDLKLDVERSVSTDGKKFVEEDKIAIAENRTTPLYVKLAIKNPGKVSVTDVTFEPFFEKGKSDMTAANITDLSGASWNKAKNAFEISKIKVNETITVTYKRNIKEEGRNSNPAIDGLKLTAFKANVSRVQDGFTYKGIGDVYKTELYAGKIPSKNNGNGNANGKPSIPKILTMQIKAGQKTAKPGDIIDFEASITNATTGNLTGLVINHRYDRGTLEFVKAIGGNNDGKNITWKRAIIRPGQTIKLAFSLKVKQGAPEGTIEGLTTGLVNEHEGVAPVKNTIQIVAGAPSTNGKQIELAATGPGMTLLLIILSIIGYFSYGRVEEVLYAFRKRQALKSL